MRRAVLFIVIASFALLGCRDDDPKTPDIGVQPDAAITDSTTPTPDKGPGDGPVVQPDKAVVTPDGPKADKNMNDLPPFRVDYTVSSKKLVITEFFPNPDGSDTDREFVEIFNPGSTPIDLKGWTIQDEEPPPKTQDRHVITQSVVVGAGKYVLIGMSTDKTKNGGIDVAYAYAKFFLSNSGDEVALLDDTGAVVDRLTYPKSIIVSGATIQLKDPALDNTTMTNWCVSTNVFTGKDKGTPGKASDCGTTTDAGTPDAKVVDAGTAG